MWTGTQQARYCTVDEQTLTYTSAQPKIHSTGERWLHQVTYEREK